MGKGAKMTSERKTYLKIFPVMVLGMAAAMALVRLTTWSMGIDARDFLGRVLDAREALPRITQEQGDMLLFYGSSMTQAGFSARHFDREMQSRGVDIKSWNFGFGGLNPFFQNYYSRRIRDAFEADDRRLRMVLIEFNPFQTTTTRWRRAIPGIDSYLSILGSNEELWDIALSDPERGALLFNIKYFRGNLSSEVFTTFVLGQPFQEPPERSQMADQSEEDEARLDEISGILTEAFTKEYPDLQDTPQWYFGWQGAGTVPWERPAETVAMFPEYYSLLQYDQRLDNDRLSRIRSADILDLEFEELLVEHFIAMVGNFKAIADEVEIVLLPRNTNWIEYRPEVAARLQSVIERIERESGVRVRNHQIIPEVTPKMFSDTTHLGRYVGDIPYTEYLVDQYADRLRQDPAEK